MPSPGAVIADVKPLASVGPWETADPFLFCVHHLDRYPAGDGKLAPKASLAGSLVRFLWASVYSTRMADDGGGRCVS